MGKGYEIIISENATKLDAIYSGLEPDSQRFVRKSGLFFSFDTQMSKLLLARDLGNLDQKSFFSGLLYGFVSSNDNVKQAITLMDQVDVPDWKIKEEILNEKKKDLEQFLSERFDIIKDFLRNHLGFELPIFHIFLAYAPEGATGGCYVVAAKPTIILRVSSATNIKDKTQLIAHELMHLLIDNTEYKARLSKLAPPLEEALFDLLMKKLRIKKVVSWENEINRDIFSRSGDYENYVWIVFEMIKPILEGEDDLVWKYIDWDKLEKIKSKATT